MNDLNESDDFVPKLAIIKSILIGKSCLAIEVPGIVARRTPPHLRCRGALHTFYNCSDVNRSTSLAVLSRMGNQNSLFSRADVNECLEGACAVGEECVNTPGSFRCQARVACEPGFKLQPRTRRCLGRSRLITRSQEPSTFIVESQF